MTLLAERGFDVSGFTPDLMTSADDVFWFPNMVGPGVPGECAAVPRASERARSRTPRSRTRGCSSGRVPGSEWQMPERRFYADWHERKWGEITEQDYTNLANVQRGMRSRGFDGSRLASKQESNVLHMHRVVDRYLTDARLIATTSARASAAAEEVLAVAFREAGPQLGDVVGVERPVRELAVGSPPHVVVAFPALALQHALEHLLRRGRRKAVRDPHEARHPLRREVRLRLRGTRRSRRRRTSVPSCRCIATITSSPTSGDGTA